MKNMINKLITKFKEINIFQFIVILITINLIFFIIYYGKIFIFIDTSREVFIPYLMNNGDVLYKDILNVYPPLGYQINSFITSIFGDKLNTFYIAGLINSILMSIGLFLITRILTVKKYPLFIFSVLLLIISSCFYAVSHTGYIFPYSYSMIYSLNAFIWSILALIYYLRKNEIKFLYSSAFLFGICTCCKYEFIPFIFILIGVILYKKLNFKAFLFSIVSLLSIPLISLFVLIKQGLEYSDITMAMDLIYKLSKAQSTLYLYKYLGFIPTTENIKLIGINFIKFSSVILITTIYIKTIFDFLNKKNYITPILKKVIAFIPIGITFIFIYKQFTISNSFVFNWIGIFTIVLFILFCCKIMPKKEKKETDIIFFVTFSATLICSFKSIFNISFNSYGTYFFPLLIICSFVYITKYIIKIDFYRNIFTFIILSTAILYTTSNIYRSYHFFDTKEQIKTEKGNFYIDGSQTKNIKKTLTYIKNNTKESDNILVLPEGAMINYLTDRNSHNKFYYLIPPNIEIIGEQEIKNKLEENLPEYIIIQPMSYNNFGQTYFCESFGKKICDLIPQYYEKPYVITESDNDFWIAIYKLKK